jgi:hypothetical protein
VLHGIKVVEIFPLRGAGAEVSEIKWCATAGSSKVQLLLS